MEERNPDLTTAAALNSGAIHLLRNLSPVDAEAGLTPARLSALSVLVFGGPRTLGALAAAEGVAGPTMTRIVDGLIAAGLAEREPHPADGRAVYLAASRRGEALMRAAQSSRLDAIAAALAALPAPDRRRLAAAAGALDQLAATVREQAAAVSRDRADGVGHAGRAASVAARSKRGSSGPAQAHGSELFSEEHSAEVVAASFAGTPDPRLKRVISSLVQHLHAFVKDVELTEDEWTQAIAFLTATGQKCDGVRQEFILLSDVLGISMLVETINHRAAGTSTESTVLGPFHMVDSPPRELGDTIALDGKGEACLVTGRVTGAGGEPLAGAQVDVWQASAEGFYDVQQPGVQPELNLRGLFTAGGDGRFWFRTIMPRYYPIPADGPVGQFLAVTGRHPYRPAHIHFIVSAPGYRPVTTHLFVDDSPYLDSDAVFGVKDSLVRQFLVIDDPARAEEAGLPNPFRAAAFEVRLLRAGEASPA